jgi:hypothetical protein
MPQGLDPNIDPSTWQTGDQIKCNDDGMIGTVTERGYGGIKVRWSDDVTSLIGFQSNVAGRFEKVPK